AESVTASRLDGGEYRFDRIERSVRGAGACGDTPTRPGSVQSECQRRRYCSRASVGMHRIQTHGDVAARNATAQLQIRTRYHVRRRRHGCRRSLRANRRLGEVLMTKQLSATVKGGSFLVAESAPEDVFTPEDFSEEQSMIRDMTEQFVEDEVVPQ